MTGTSENHLQTDANRPSRWKGVALGFLVWMAGYAIVGFALIAALSVLQWRG